MIDKYVYTQCPKEVELLFENVMIYIAGRIFSKAGLNKNFKK